MDYQATGTFDVSLQPQAEPDVSAGATLGRMSLYKRFQGDLVAVGQGEMLTAIRCLNRRI